MGLLRVLFFILRLVLGPSNRRKLYLFVQKYSHKLYGHNESFCAAQFPFNLYFKQGMNTVNEVQALKMVRRHLSSRATKTQLALVPEVLDVADDCFIMTRVPGEPLGNMYSKLDDDERAQVASQLTEFVKALRSIPYPLDSERSRHIGPVSGPLPHLPAYDNNRIWEDQFGPFETLPEFHSFLLHHRTRHTGSFPERYAMAHDLSAAPNSDNLQETTFSKRTVFSHCDLHLRNILAERRISYEKGQPASKIVITGVVDWECAGWFPIYWDHAKAVYRHRVFQKFRDCWEQIAKNTIPLEALEKYNNDLALEEEMWTYMDCF